MAHRSRGRFSRACPCHVTIRVRSDVPGLRSRRLVRELEQSFARGCERGEFRLVHYSILGNHAHLLVEAKDRNALGRGMKSLGACFSRAVNRVFARTGPVLVDRYHVSVLKNPTQVRNALTANGDVVEYSTPRPREMIVNGSELNIQQRPRSPPVSTARLGSSTGHR